ncbi:MAG: hypothetical protein K6E38_04110 [Fretibacterium sp.]|nr:hypothetical protein [Fretibacterium sp.]
MKVWVDNQERKELSLLASPEEILAAVNEEAARSGRVLADIRIDGMTVDAEVFGSLKLMAGKESGHTVAFMLTPIRTLLRESLDTAVEYSQKLMAGTEEAASKFECGEVEKALPTLPCLFDGLGWLIGVYDRSRTFMPVPVRLDEEAAMTGKILETLRLLVRLADEGNFAAMAQTLRWELLPSIKTLAQRVKDLSGLRAGLQ